MYLGLYGKKHSMYRGQYYPWFQESTGVLEMYRIPHREGGTNAFLFPHSSYSGAKGNSGVASLSYMQKKNRNKKQSQDAECWWLTAFYLEKMQTKIKSTLKPKKGGDFCVRSTNPSGS